jgi:Spy/CpxP family protein refolding chaperone
MQRPGRAGVYPPNLNFNLMKNQLKSASLILALALAAMPTLRAADTPADKPEQKREHGPGGPGRAGDMMEHAAKELSLTADQQAKWKAIGQEEKAALKTLEEDKRAKAQEINKGFAAQRRAVLTPDQAKKFDEKREERREKMKEHREERRHKGEKDADK